MIKFNTVTQKIMFLMTAISVIVLIIVSALFPSIFYYAMKPYLIKQISSVIASSALRQSYIWKNNNILHDLQLDEELQNLVIEYVQQKETDATQAEITRKRIVSFLPILTNGIDALDPSAEHGYIISTHYFILFTDQGDVFFDSGSEDIAQILFSSEWYRNLDKTEEFFDHPPIIEDPENPDSRILCMVSSFLAGEINCFAVNAVNLDDILAQFSEFQDFGIEDFLIYGNGQIIYQNLPNSSHIDLSKYPSSMFNGNQYEICIWEDHNETNFMTLCTYKKEFYRIAANVPKSLLLQPYREAFQYFQLLLGMIIVILLLLFCVTMRENLKRLVKLEKKMNYVRKGDYNVSIEDNGHDEISSLANTFTMMLSQIREDMKNEEKMQYTLMVSAIDPHYIYNTLNTVTALAELGRSKDVIAVNDALIATLKDRMKLKNYKIFDTVRAEREALKQYMVIQSYLCYQQIIFQFEVAQEDLDLMIPKNIIQPLVENSIKHGILCKEDDYDLDKTKHESHRITQNDISDNSYCIEETSNPYQGQITVSVSKDGENIQIEICDNGAGMDDETINHFFCQNLKKDMKPEKNMEHIGTYNVQMRLHYLYQGKQQFFVESTPGQGTRLHLILPFIDAASTPTTIESLENFVK